MANDALHANPADEQVTINTSGSDFLWMVFAVMFVSTLAMVGWSYFVPRGKRAFHSLSIIALTVSSIAYFAMASNLGQTGIVTEFNPEGLTRSIWYARYIQWVLATPAVLLQLAFMTALPLSDIANLIFFDLTLWVSWLIGGLVTSSYKWGFYAFGLGAIVYIWAFFASGVKGANSLGADFKKAYLTGASLVSFLLILYPIAWGLSEGGNKISPDGEMVFYGILDLLLFPVLTFVNVGLVSRLDYSAMQLASGKVSATNNTILPTVAPTAEKKNALVNATAAAEPRSSTATAVETV